MKSFHDLFAELEADIASLLDRFRSHPAVQAAAAAPAEPPADFSPVPPEGVKPPVVPIGPAAPPAPSSGAPVPTQSTDATAPNFKPADTAPAPAAPEQPAMDPYAPVIDWSATGEGSSYNYKFHVGGGTKTFVVPEGYKGYFEFAVGDDTDAQGSKGYDCTMNGANPYHAANGANEVAYRVFIGIPVDNPADPRNIAGVPGTYTLTVTCDGGATSVLRHWP